MTDTEALIARAAKYVESNAMRNTAVTSLLMDMMAALAAAQPRTVTSEEIEYFERRFDNFLTNALSIHDVMKAVPHPYNAVADMTNKWAHDFVGFAFQVKRRFLTPLTEEQP